jgi:hypothetical protein
MYDLSKLKTDGSHYVVVSFNIPYCLELPDGNYPVVISRPGGACTAQVILKRKYGQSVGEPVPIAGRKQGIYYSSVDVYFPLRWPDPHHHADITRVSGYVFDENDEVYRALALGATNRLITVYRFSTGEYHCKPVSGLDDHSLALLFNENPPDAGTPKFRALHQGFQSSQSVLKTFVDIPNDTAADLKSKLESDFEVPLSEELILNAYDFLSQGNYRLAIIEMEAGFEAAALGFLVEYYHTDSESTRELETINSFVTLLKHPLVEKAFASRSVRFTKGDERYQEWDQYVWKVRGKLVHGKCSTASREDADKAIETIEGVLAYLLQRPRTELRRFAHSKIG